MQVRITQEFTESATSQWRWEIFEDDELGAAGYAPSFPEAAVAAWNFVEATQAIPRCSSSLQPPTRSMGGEAKVIRCRLQPGHFPRKLHEGVVPRGKDGASIITWTDAEAVKLNGRA